MPIPGSLGGRHGRTGRRLTAARAPFAPPSPPLGPDHHPSSDASLVLGIIFLAGAWWLRDRAPISFGWVLRAQPEAQLFYPGSSVLLDGGQDYTIGLTGPSPAFYIVTLGVDAPDAAILDFYRQRMPGRPGWFTTTPTGGVDSRATLTWASERFLMQIELPDPTVLRAEGYPGPNYYRLRLMSLSPR